MRKRTMGVLDGNGWLRVRSFVKDVEEFGIDGSSIGYAEVNDSDLVARSLGREYTMGEEVFVLCDLWKKGKPLETYSRNILKRVLEKHEIEVLVGYEVEFHIMEEERRGFYMAPSPVDRVKGEKFELLEFLNSLGIPAVLEHHEVGRGQHEITIEAGKLPEKADEFYVAKYAMRKFFERKGLEVTFMPKPFTGEPGNGNHIHLSVWKEGKNLFEGEGLSKFGRSFLAGVLKYAREIALATNSTVNSYKRLVPGHEAPTVIAWGFGNRSALVRVPDYRKHDRIEIRNPDCLCDFYLALAAIVEAGMKGVEEGLNPPEPSSEVLYGSQKYKSLPANLGEAIEEAEKGNILKKLLGSRFEGYIKQKKREWEEYVKATGDREEVTEWERNRYLLL